MKHIPIHQPNLMYLGHSVQLRNYQQKLNCLVKVAVLCKNSNFSWNWPKTHCLPVAPKANVSAPLPQSSPYILQFGFNFLLGNRFNIFSMLPEWVLFCMVATETPGRTQGPPLLLFFALCRWVYTNIFWRWRDGTICIIHPCDCLLFHKEFFNQLIHNWMSCIVAIRLNL